MKVEIRERTIVDIFYEDTPEGKKAAERYGKKMKRRGYSHYSTDVQPRTKAFPYKHGKNKWILADQYHSKLIQKFGE